LAEERQEQTKFASGLLKEKMEGQIGDMMNHTVKAPGTVNKTMM
jgi:hypothetical protein